MRGFVLSFIAIVVVFVPKLGSAQGAPLRMTPPEVNAATADWQLNSEPIIVSSTLFQATRASRMFDGQVMVQVGVYQGVPVYADVTLEPNSLLYVPVGRNQMRVYERRRDHDLAATTGSRTPSFPVGSSASAPAGERAVGTTGTIVPAGVGPANAVPHAPRTVMETIQRPRHGTNGVWLDFVGVSWYSSGSSASYSADRFTKVGEYRGFPVYVETVGSKDTIWVQVTNGGPLAPYARR
jgi:hypothetical protein